MLTWLRIGLTVPVAWLLYEEAYVQALWLFAAAGVTDGLDGYLAKRYGWTSRLGSILDPLADKLLLVSSYVILGVQGHLPWWLVGAIIARDVIILVGALAYHYLIGHVEMAPTLISKSNTVCQILLVLLVVMALATAWLPSVVVQGAIYLVLITTILSGIEYILTWSRRAWRGRSFS